MTDPDRVSLEEQRRRYLRRAEEAMAHAAAAVSPELRGAYLKLSDSWLALAQELEAAAKGKE